MVEMEKKKKKIIIIDHILVAKMSCLRVITTDMQHVPRDYSIYRVPQKCSLGSGYTERRAYNIQQYKTDIR